MNGTIMRDTYNITAPHLVWFRYGELSLKMIRDCEQFLMKIRSSLKAACQILPA